MMDEKFQKINGLEKLKATSIDSTKMVCNGIESHPDNIVFQANLNEN